MYNLKLKYYNSFQEAKINKDRINGILEKTDDLADDNKSEIEKVEQALACPISSKTLNELSKNKNNILIITSDHTRPVPSKITLPILLSHIRKGNPKVNIKILIATGCHRPSTEKELLYKLTEEIYCNEDIVIHNGNDFSEMTYKGILPSGGELWLNKLIDWADFILAEGFIEPHFFAGFSGGRKSILPGIAYKKTVYGNHCSKLLSSKNSSTGNLKDNPIHDDMIFASEKANLSFILNVILDNNNRIKKAYAGDPLKAHLLGCSDMYNYTKIDRIKADIVIVSNGGYPLGQDIYQSVKGMHTASKCTNKNGVIIMVASCCNGHGGSDFYNWIKGEKDPRELLRNIMLISQEETVKDQWQVQMLAKIMVENKIIIVTDMCDPKIITDMHMLHTYTLEDAIKKAEEIKGKEATFTIIPDGVGVIIN